MNLGGRDASAALNHMTATAIAAGTPTYPFFDQGCLPSLGNSFPHLTSEPTEPIHLGMYIKEEDYFGSVSDRMSSPVFA